MIAQLGTSFRMTIVTVILLGLLYPLAMTGVARVALPWQAGGSLVTIGGHVVGSALDRAALPQIIGTVAGDDTLVVIVADGLEGSAVGAQLSELAGL